MRQVWFGRGKANRECVDGWTVGDWGSILLGILQGTLQKAALNFPTKVWKNLGTYPLIAVLLCLRNVLKALNPGSSRLPRT